MNRKARKLKKELGGYKAAGIANIVAAVMLWIATAGAWPMLEDIRAGLLLHAPDIHLSWFTFLGPLILFIVIGSFVLATGIGMLKFTGRVADVLRDIVPDEDDE